MIHLERALRTGRSGRVAVAASIVAVVCLAPAWAAPRKPDQVAQAPAAAPQSAPYACQMHPNVRSKAAGTCSICGMTLVPTGSPDEVEYNVEIETPRGIVAGHPFRLRLTVRHPDSRAMIRDFAVVHEKRFHMFVIGADLAHYDHVHPEQQPDGSWALDLTLPRSGRYRLYSDFLPSGGTPQVDNQPLVTSDVEAGDIAAAEGRLVPDGLLNHVVGDLSVTLELPAGGLLAGREEKFLYRLADAKTGKPVEDVEPYLGAWGHSLAVSENMSRVVHAHPVELVPAGRPTARGGPTLTFKAALPEAGTYRIWTQIKRHGEVATAVFTVRAEAASGGGVDAVGAVRTTPRGMRHALQSLPPQS